MPQIGLPIDTLFLNFLQALLLINYDILDQDISRMMSSAGSSFISDVRVCNPATPREGRKDKTELIDYPTITTNGSCLSSSLMEGKGGVETAARASVWVVPFANT